MFNSHFVDIGGKIASIIPATAGDPVSFLTGDYSSSFFFKPVSPQSVSDTIQSLRNKCYNINTISTKVLKFISPIVSSPLSAIINTSLTSGRFPDSMKLARVVPVKKTGDPTDMGNYHPISVLPIISKVFRKMVNSQLYNYMCQNKILYPTQYYVHYSSYYSSHTIPIRYYR